MREKELHTIQTGILRVIKFPQWGSHWTFHSIKLESIWYSWKLYKEVRKWKYTPKYNGSSALLLFDQRREREARKVIHHDLLSRFYPILQQKFIRRRLECSHFHNSRNAPEKLNMHSKYLSPVKWIVLLEKCHLPPRSCLSTTSSAWSYHLGSTVLLIGICFRIFFGQTFYWCKYQKKYIFSALPLQHDLTIWAA